MNLVYLAHDFPPERSPQSLRAARLAKGLADAGHEVTVISRALHLHERTTTDGNGGEGLTVLRLPAGPLNRLADRILGWSERRRASRSGADAAMAAGDLSAARPAAVGEVALSAGRANWKGRALAGLRELEDRLHFPGRGWFWSRHVARALPQLLAARRVDGVVFSHEPAAALTLARVCETRGIPFVLELADPVLAPYTPRRWRRKAWRLEADVCRRAAGIVVTSDATARLLAERHAIGLEKFEVVTQGFDPPQAAGKGAPPGDASPLQLVYCGRFYPFRDPTPLFDAVASLPSQVEWRLATPGIPVAFARNPGQVPNILDLGFLSHARSLALQAGADVLVNFANADPRQIPGKFFEYLGAGKPILHISAHEEADEQARMLLALRRGWVLPPDAGVIAAHLSALAGRRRAGQLEAELDLGMDKVQRYSWPMLGSQFAATIERFISPATR